MLFTSSAFAILPQQGMWSIGSEVNGKPGRGIQLDRQGGDYLIITYIGYRPDGSSMFLQASGKLTDGMFFSGELTEYRNGRSIGGEARDGEIAQVVGPISIKFDSTTSGTLTLPGEEPKRFSRYQFEDHIARLNHGFEYRSYRSNSPYYDTNTAGIRAEPGHFSMTEFSPSTLGKIECRYTGDLKPTGETFTSSGTVSCTYPNSTVITTSQYQFIDIKVDERAMFSARVYISPLNTNPIEQAFDMRHLQGTCGTSGAVIATGGEARCNTDELGINVYSAADWISPSWISGR